MMTRTGVTELWGLDCPEGSCDLQSSSDPTLFCSSSFPLSLPWLPDVHDVIHLWETLLAEMTPLSSFMWPLPQCHSEGENGTLGEPALLSGLWLILSQQVTKDLAVVFSLAYCPNWPPGSSLSDNPFDVIYIC